MKQNSLNNRLTLKPATYADWQQAKKFSRLPDPPEFDDYPAPYDSLAWSENEFKSRVLPMKYEVSAIVLDSGLLIGFVKAFDFSEDTCECGIEIFDPQHYGQGYATEALGLFLDTLKQRPGLRQVVGLIHPQNQRSHRLFAKLGFVHTDQWADPEYQEHVFERYCYAFY
jgi:RimJ/RimL family protein N-acetyltransferase